MADLLQEYRQKRKFDKTTEPKAKVGHSTQKLHFVVQHHIASRDHFDFRLEWGGVLLSWAVPKGPSFNPHDKRLAIRVEDHPLEYKNFEGSIPQGQYGGGVVMLWDEGFWQCQGDAGKALSEGALKFELLGKRLQGHWALIRTKDNNWLLIKEKDGFSAFDSAIEHFDTSVTTGRTMQEIRQEKPPKKTKKQSAKADSSTKSNKQTKIKPNPFSSVNVQLARLFDSLPKANDWLYELKYDGFRIVAFVDSNNVRLVSRNDHDYTKQFFEIANSLEIFLGKHSAVLDGEVVVANEQGRTDFQALQSYLKKPAGKQLSYIVFDILALDGTDLRQKPLVERKKILQQLLKNSPSNVLFSQHSDNLCQTEFNALCDKQYEGIIAKKANSVYSGTRNGDWVKLKCDTRQEFVVGGFTYTSKKTDGISALLLGQYQNSQLIYVGRAGTGFTQKLSQQLRQQLTKIRCDTSQFCKTPKIGKEENVVWTQPKYSAEIKFAEWTKENLLRQASFKGLNDYLPQPAIENTFKKAKNMQDNTKKQNLPKLTNPQKLMFQNPKVTKAEVADYYTKVSKRMLPYLQNRVLSLICCPKGISDPCFFKKHPFADNEGIIPVEIKNSKNKTDTFFTLDSLSGLLYAVQMNSVEFHCWASLADSVDQPDMMVFDLDPDEGVGLKQVRQGVRHLKSILDELSLTCFLKVSGGKGYHVVVPFVPSVDFSAFSDFSRRVAEFMEEKWTNLYTTNIRKINRKGKIFIDFLRNSRGATSVAPYSLRAREGAKVAMPIGWNELDSIEPDGISIEQAIQRLEKADPWANFFKVKCKQILS